MRQTAVRTQIPYLKSHDFLRTWSERQCEVCDVEDVHLLSARPAPPVAHGQAKAVPARVEEEVPPRAKKQEDPYLNTFNAAFKVADAASAFSSWLRSPAPTPPQAKASPPPPPGKKVPPFDIQDVSKTMRKLGMPMAAKLQERWFAGAANYSPSSRDLLGEIDQNGVRYASAMVDSTTIKMEWVLSFRRAKAAFDELIQSITAGGVPDDLTGALGSFNFYAAVRYAWFDHPGRMAVVTEVSVYVRDPYEFSDEQYLGHWSPSHVAVVPAHQVGGGWLDYPVVDGSIYDRDSVLYPVTNKDYRDWRRQHGQGGDFMIYTDRLNVKIDSPIRVAL